MRKDEAMRQGWLALSSPIQMNQRSGQSPAQSAESLKHPPGPFNEARDVLHLFASFLMAFWIAPPAGAQEQLRADYFITASVRIYSVLQPVGDQKCAQVDTNSMIPSRAKTLNQTILGEAFIPNKAGYVYWLANNTGPHEVFYTYYFIRNCVITENRTDFRQFDGEKRFESAKEYYSHTVKQLLE